MQGSWQVIIYHPEIERAAELTTIVAADGRFHCQTYTQCEGALERLAAETLDLAMVSFQADSAGTSLTASGIQEIQPHLALITLDEDMPDTESEHIVRKITWPASPTTVIGAIEGALSLPVRVEPAAIVELPVCLMPDLPDEVRPRPTAPEYTRIATAQGEEMPAERAPFACCWLPKNPRQWLEKDIRAEIESADGDLREFRSGARSLYFAAALPAAICPRQFLIDRLGQPAAFLIRQPALALSAIEQERFLQFASSTVDERQSLPEDAIMEAASL